ncbi:polysaccharide deacetylase family protein [Longimicrobium sp.]|uniref:polysaccharide deacetylase family protein n=1 Tax=Longimicrobium sp. TaxID=2029185 RepID=UPI002BCED702|nr:polysaccharide deacetylase family protein [Longimicrobium sp.]HSU13282.1 polysaccharide deacetylase family protein [Longimicrobium sp.]
MPEAAARSASALRGAVKRAAERTLTAAGADRIALAMRPAGVLVLAYHNIVPAGESARGDTSLHLPQADFGRQLDALRRTHRIVPLDQAFAPGDGDRPRAVITFDDACRGALTAGIDELARRGGLPATIFVAPGLLGSAPWWDELAGPNGLDPAVRAHALDVLGGRAAAVRAWAETAGLRRRALPTHQRIATAEELAATAARPGITLAPHGWSHASLPALTATALGDELSRPLAWLRDRFGGALPWLAYPYGHASPEVERAAERAGYQGAFRVEGGSFVLAGAAAHPFALPRLTVPAGVSDEGFRLLVSGVRRG